MEASYVWVRTPEFPEKAELVEKQPSFFNFKSKLGTSPHFISGSPHSSLGQSVCALNTKTAHLRKQALEAWKRLHLLSAAALPPAAFSQPTGHHPLDHKWSGERSSSFLALTNTLLCHELNISGI